MATGAAAADGGVAVGVCPRGIVFVFVLWIALDATNTTEELAAEADVTGKLALHRIVPEHCKNRGNDEDEFI
jgi:cytochrome b